MGTLNLRIPKLRTGSFFPEDVLERYQRVDRALVAAVAEMYATGTSTRKVQRIAGKMGIERLGRDRVSAIAATLDAEIADLAEAARCARDTLHLARRDLRQVPPRGRVAFDRGGHGDRLRRVRLEAGAGSIVVDTVPTNRGSVSCGGCATAAPTGTELVVIRCPRGLAAGPRRSLPGRAGSAARCT